jgi:peptide chain release factor 1
MEEKIQPILKEFKELEDKLNDPSIFSDVKKLKKVSQKYNQLKPIIELINNYQKTQKNIADIEIVLKTETDEELLQMASTELNDLKNLSDNLKKQIQKELKPKDPNDKKNIIMEIRAGAGGDEATLFVADLFRLYSRYAEKKGWEIKVLSSNKIGVGGYKEIIFEINGKNVYGNLKYEKGVHRVQRIPETEKSGRIHTSTATVAVLAQAQEKEVEIDPKNLRIDTFCSSGHGGQSVNTTYSAVRITHLPTNIVVNCQDERSQLQNKEKALRILRAKLLAAQQHTQKIKEATERKDQVGMGERAEKIRTYNFPQDRITDHRIKENFHNLNNFLEGNLDDLVETLKNKLS